MQNLEAEIKDAIGLGTTFVTTNVDPEPEPEPEVTIYDFGRLMDWSDNKPTTTTQST